MNKKIIIWGIIIVLAIIIGFIIYKNINLQQKEIGLNETTQNIVEISELAEQNQDAVTDECLDEWDDYNEYIGKKVESQSLVASGQDALMDAVLSFTTLIAGILNFIWHFTIEGYLGVVIGIFIIKAFLIITSPPCVVFYFYYS